MLMACKLVSQLQLHSHVNSQTVNSERHEEKEVGNGNSPPPTEAQE